MKTQKTIYDMYSITHDLKKTGYTLFVEPDSNQLAAYNPTRESIELAFATPIKPQGVLFVGSDYEKDGLYPTQSHIRVSMELFEQMQQDLKRENSDIRRLSSWPVKRGFVYVDISDFSSLKRGEQLVVINSLIPAVNKLSHWQNHRPNQARAALEACLCIGDGYIYVINMPEYTLYFAAYLATIIEQAVVLLHKEVPKEFNFRMGAHIGDVCCFWDIDEPQHVKYPTPLYPEPIKGRWNYIGDGINGGQRILAAVGKDLDNVLFVSKEVRNTVVEDSMELNHEEVRNSWLQNLINMGRRKDKHGKFWHVYQVNHHAIAGKDLPDVLMPTRFPKVKPPTNDPLLNPETTESDDSDDVVV